jgi:quercetin dioxygenase-like cupin family protein
MDVKRNGSQPTRYGPADTFTGTVFIDSPFEAPDPAHVGGAHVTFEPGARTAWHSHPLGQTLIVTSGLGRVQRWGSRSRRFALGTRSGLSLGKNIGTVLHQRRL